MPGFVKLICDSVNPDGVRLSTFEVSVHLFNWVDWLTHRDFSRNAQSNRAIPTKKIIENVRNDLAYPYHWGKNQPGMEAEEELTPDQIEVVKAKWHKMAMEACDNAEELLAIGGHKQFVNRSLAPYMWIRAIISSTRWDNFFNLRCHHAAQPEIRIPAEWMRAALKENTPKKLKWGEWHRPLIREEDFIWANEKDKDLPIRAYREVPATFLNKISVAKCARVSYLSHNGEREPEKEIELHNRLMSDNHMSPFEHCAMADEQRRSISNFDSSWLQYRKVVESNNPYFLL